MAGVRPRVTADRSRDVTGSIGAAGFHAWGKRVQFLLSQIERSRRPRLAALEGRLCRRVLVMPRTQVFERLFFLPTHEPALVEKMMEFRLAKAFPFPMEDIDFAWKVVGTRADGHFLVRVIIVEHSRMKKYLATCGIDEPPRGIVLEDELLAAWQARFGTDMREREWIEVYETQGRLLTSRVREGQCLSSNVIASHGVPYSESAVRIVASPLTEDLFDSLTAEPAPAAVPTRPRYRMQSEMEIPVPAEWELESIGVENPFLATLTQTATKPSAATMPLEGGGWLIDPEQFGGKVMRCRIQELESARLFPAPWRNRATGATTVVRCFLVLVSLLAVGALCTTIVGGLALHNEHATSRINKNRIGMQAGLREVEAAQNLLRHVGPGNRDEDSILATWDRIAASLPPQVSLSTLHFESDGTVRVQGQSDQTQGVLHLAEALRTDAAEVFEGVWLGGVVDQEGRKSFTIFVRTHPGGTSPATPEAGAVHP